MTRLTDRRQILATIAAGVTVAGCSRDSGDSAATPAITQTVDSASERRVVNYLIEEPAAENFDGDVVDETGRETVTIAVGASGNGGNFAFAPPAVSVSSGTTISWEWTGEGGTHNVLSAEKSDITLDSGSAVEQRDPYTERFDEAGVALYYCQPHRTLGMVGGIVVE